MRAAARNQAAPVAGGNAWTAAQAYLTVTGTRLLHDARWLGQRVRPELSGPAPYRLDSLIPECSTPRHLAPCRLELVLRHRRTLLRREAA